MDYFFPALILMPSLTIFQNHSSHTVKTLLSATGYAFPSLLTDHHTTNRELGACSTTLSMVQIPLFQASNTLTEHMKVLLAMIILSVFCQLRILGVLLLLKKSKAISFLKKTCNLSLLINYLCIYWHGIIIVRILSH